MNSYITRVADEIADILLREGIGYVQAVFRAARIKAGLHAPKETRNAPARLTLEEQLRFIDAAYARNGRTGLMVQTLLETGTRVSKFVALRVEDVSLGERTIAVESGKRREIPICAAALVSTALMSLCRPVPQLFPVTVTVFTLSPPFAPAISFSRLFMSWSMLVAPTLPMIAAAANIHAPTVRTAPHDRRPARSCAVSASFAISCLSPIGVPIATGWRLPPSLFV